MHWTFRALTIALLTGGAALAAGVDFQAGDNGRMAFAVDGAMMAEGFSVRIVKPEWTGTFDDVTRTEVLKLEPGQSRFDNTVADVATYQVTAEKKDSSVAVTYDLEFIKETPIEHASVVVYIPISFAQQGGTLSTSSQSDVPFPARCEKKFIYSGLTELLSWTNGLGQGITLRLPSPTYVQIQDNRVFEWSVFELNIRLPGDGKVGKSSFTLTVEPGAAKTEKPQPFVDRYGQCTKKEWPGKVTADEQLAADIESQPVRQRFFRRMARADGTSLVKAETAERPQIGLEHIQQILEPVAVAVFNEAFQHLGGVQRLVQVRGMPHLDVVGDV